MTCGTHDTNCHRQPTRQKGIRPIEGELRSCKIVSISIPIVIHVKERQQRRRSKLLRAREMRKYPQTLARVYWKRKKLFPVVCDFQIYFTDFLIYYNP